MATEQQKLAGKINGTMPLDPGELVAPNGADFTEPGFSGTAVTMTQNLALGINRTAGLSKDDNAQERILNKRAILVAGNSYTINSDIATALIAQGIAT